MTTTPNVKPAAEETVEEFARQFEQEHPEVRRALDLFNLSLEHYEAALRPLQTRTYITTHTLLPGEHG
ncbi:MAG TPA: hypothetical protein DEV93_22340 [Chloroflexi bacterium]|jgi:hypothetical protein|nr:hypothetical protein [Chloroflexota bacterium]